uniref:JmjC domain-containing histone demethylation protein 1 n=1 Tax=Anthurium amnicola TaxID=1678845 RepID=A0A1D1YPB7_9ARAE
MLVGPGLRPLLLGIAGEEDSTAALFFSHGSPGQQRGVCDQANHARRHRHGRCMAARLEEDPQALGARLHLPHSPQLPGEDVPRERGEVLRAYHPHRLSHTEIDGISKVEF